MTGVALPACQPRLHFLEAGPVHVGEQLDQRDYRLSLQCCFSRNFLAEPLHINISRKLKFVGSLSASLNAPSSKLDLFQPSVFSLVLALEGKNSSFTYHINNIQVLLVSPLCHEELLGYVISFIGWPSLDRKIGTLYCRSSRSCKWYRVKPYSRTTNLPSFFELPPPPLPRFVHSSPGWDPANLRRSRCSPRLRRSSCVYPAISQRRIQNYCSPVD